MSVTHAHLLDRLATAIANLHPHRRIRVAIDGVDGAGKTTLADALAPLVSDRGRPVIRASVDHFHNSRSMRYARGRYSPDGFYLDSYDYGTLRALLLDPLGPDGSGRHIDRYFDHERDQRLALEERQAAPTAALIFDGIFLHRRELRDYWDLSVFLMVAFKNSLPRGAQRGTNFDATDPKSPAHRRYVGGQRRYLAECKPERRANIAIDYNDLGKPEILKWF